MMNCNDDIGCAIPGTELKKLLTTTETVNTQQAELIFVTDPICSACWAIEPIWRRLLLTYEIKVRYIHGGLLPGWQGFGDAKNGILKPTDVIPHWRHVAEYSGQPIDPSVWAIDPLSNSHIICKAAIAVRLLQSDLEAIYVRFVREQLFLHAVNVANEDVLTTCAKSIGLDPDAFRLLLHSDKVAILFDDERQEMINLGSRGFPSLVFKSNKNNVLSGCLPYESYADALKVLAKKRPYKRYLTDLQKLHSFRSWTVKEATEVLQHNKDQAIALLNAAGFNPLSIAGAILWVK